MNRRDPTNPKIAMKIQRMKDFAATLQAMTKNTNTGSLDISLAQDLDSSFIKVQWTQQKVLWTQEKVQRTQELGNPPSQPFSAKLQFEIYNPELVRVLEAKNGSASPRVQTRVVELLDQYADFSGMVLQSLSKIEALQSAHRLQEVRLELSQLRRAVLKLYNPLSEDPML